jgi:hypothetical protein
VSGRILRCRENGHKEGAVKIMGNNFERVALGCYNSRVPHVPRALAVWLADPAQ